MKLIILFFLSIVALSCNKEKATKKNWFQADVEFVEKQLNHSVQKIEASGKFLNPITLNKDSSVRYCSFYDWRSGFFSGTIWYLFDLTGNESYKLLAQKYTETLERAQSVIAHHDVGFMINCSFGNGYRLTGDSVYKSVIIQAAKSLATRFHPIAGVIQSWDVDRGWQSQRGWQCPVTIDNLMNLELLFKATELSSDSLYFKIAVSHADRTLAEHCRLDGSCYHVVDYSVEDGSVLHKDTAQGYSEESTWSRGQSWAVYGFTICYRATRNSKYLEQAVRTFNRMKYHPAMPDDLIPYWDMDAPKIPHELRDVSSASCLAAALYEICLYDTVRASLYENYADSIMSSLSTDRYRAIVGENGGFLLMHSVGSIPHNSEVDVPLCFADYYFIEALKRKQDLLNRH